MLARLILALLLAAFAVPAMASSPCHDATASMVMAPGHTMPMRNVPKQDDRAIVAHVCIGCIPPSNMKSGAAARSRMASTEVRIARFIRLDPGEAPAPATPPPRKAA